MKSFYKHVHDAWKKPKENIGDIVKKRLVEWREGHTVERIEKPTRLDRARSLGYKAKKGYVLARVKLKKGGRHRRLYGRRGRKPVKSGLTRFTPKKGLRWIAEEKANRKFPNLEVLNSYLAVDDGVNKWFECILVDPNDPNIKSDKKINWVINQRKRALHGLTSAGKKARGLR